MDPGARADAADADDFVRGVDPLELLERMVDDAERPPVLGDERVHVCDELLAVGDVGDEIAEWDDQRRLGDDAKLAVDLVRPLREDARVVAGARLREVLRDLRRLVLAETLLVDLRADELHDLVDVDVSRTTRRACASPPSAASPCGTRRRTR